MELAQIIQTLLQRKRAVAVVVVAAFCLSLLTAYKPTTGGLKPRSLEYGAVTQQILIDSPNSALADLNKDTTPLSVRAMVYAEFMRSSAVVGAVAKRLHISPDQITSEGPFSSVGSRDNVTGPEPARSAQVTAEGDTYRLAFDAQDGLPVITIYTQGPTTKKAMAASRAVVASLQTYVSGLQNQEALKPSSRVLIRSLGPADGGPVNHGARKALIALAFLLLTGLGCAGIVMVAGVRRSMTRLSDLDGFEQEWDVVGPEVPGPADDVAARPHLEAQIQ
jgi:hypothetical protein